MSILYYLVPLTDCSPAIYSTWRHECQGWSSDRPVIKYINHPLLHLPPSPSPSSLTLATASTAFAAILSHATYHCAFRIGSIMSFDRLQIDSYRIPLREELPYLQIGTTMELSFFPLNRPSSSRRVITAALNGIIHWLLVFSLQSITLHWISSFQRILHSYQPYLHRQLCTWWREDCASGQPV